MARRLSQLAKLPVTELSGVGPKAAEGLAEAFEIRTVLDLLTHYPRRWIDRTNEARIRDLRPGDQAMVVAEVRRITARRTRGRPPRTLVTADVSDGSGHLKVTFFNQGWRERQLPAGTQCILFGKVDSYRGEVQMTNPVVDLIGDQTGRFVPVYPQSEKVRVTSQDVGRWMKEVLERAGEFAEPLPDWVTAEHTLVDRTRAFRGIHHPEEHADISVARKRLVFDELLRVQLALILRKRALERVTKGIEHVVRPDDPDTDLVARFHERLPFPLTRAQRRVVDDIAADLAGPHPMHRLLQGDVGAGKTVVAVSALLVAVQGGHQGALMAPTEVLAEQHHLGIRRLLDGLTVGDGGLTLLGERPVGVELLTARSTASDRQRIAAGLERGDVDIVIGTHALIQGTVAFRDLGVVVVDEQHRFGVEQRAALREQGAGDVTPDVLVMTATPIPRTAAMTVYGDLDVSILDELPPGRTPITTHWVRTAPPEGEEGDEDDGDAFDPATLDPDVLDPEAKVWEAVRSEVAAGRQAYVVCPLIEESDKLEAASAQETYDRLTFEPDGELADLRVALLHGRVPPAEKEAVMERFRTGAIDVLVATTVIEVGVDVPNATVMVVLDADRFGIAQLHQLRGRVGRGAHASTCYLLGAGSTEEGEARLEAMVRTTDGFELAEVDLDLRGEGTLMGGRQKGRSDLKLASLRRDREWVQKARDVATRLIDDDPELAHSPLLTDEVSLFLGEEEQDFLLKG
jgi:ATP-dependent DNA helicase RecG